MAESLPVVDKAHGPAGRYGCGSQSCTVASVHDTEAAGSTVGKLGVVQSQGEGTSSAPGQVIGVGKVGTEAAGALIVLARPIECGLQKRPIKQHAKFTDTFSLQVLGRLLFESKQRG